MIDQTPLLKLKKLVYLLAALVALLAAGLLWQAYKLENLSAEHFLTNGHLEAYKLENSRNLTFRSAHWNTLVEFADGGFSVRLPDGWGPIQKDTAANYMALLGELQPQLRGGNKTDITEVSDARKDLGRIFTVQLVDKGAVATPRGVAEDFEIRPPEADSQATEGKKYTYVYPKDELIEERISLAQRWAGDRDYTYVLPTPDGRELVVQYSVLASDPRNQVEIVDEIVQRIRFAD